MSSAQNEQYYINVSLADQKVVFESMIQILDIEGNMLRFSDVPMCLMSKCFLILFKRRNL